jgi:hypothetical protein
VHRASSQRLQLVVVLHAVELERVEAARAFFGIEPAFRPKHARRVDAVLEPMQRGELQVLESGAPAYDPRDVKSSHEADNSVDDHSGSAARAQLVGQFHPLLAEIPQHPRVLGLLGVLASSSQRAA